MVAHYLNGLRRVPFWSSQLRVVRVPVISMGSPFAKYLLTNSAVFLQATQSMKSDLSFTPGRSTATPNGANRDVGLRGFEFRVFREPARNIYAVHRFSSLLIIDVRVPGLVEKLEVVTLYSLGLKRCPAYSYAFSCESGMDEMQTSTRGTSLYSFFTIQSTT